MSVDLIDVCPECDSANVHARPGGYNGKVDPDAPRYRCGACGAEFDEPDAREPKAETGSQYASVQALKEADPDDWPKREDDLRADGHGGVRMRTGPDAITCGCCDTEHDDVSAALACCADLFAEKTLERADMHLVQAQTRIDAEPAEARRHIREARQLLQAAAEQSEDEGELVTDGGLEQNIEPGRHSVESEVRFGGMRTDRLDLPTDGMNHVSGSVSIEVSGASGDWPWPARVARELEAAVVEALENVGPDGRSDGERAALETDGGESA
jgi:hypothetical protein